jgi:hypothetical protein
MTDEQQHTELVAWLETDETGSRPYRAARLQVLLNVLHLPETGMMHMGGVTSMHALTELRLTYIHGLYLATVLLALVYIEQELAGSLHASGWDKAASARLEILLTEASNRGYLNTQEFEIFNRLREVRNAYAHYRNIMHPMSGIRRSVAEETPVDELLEVDALQAVRGVASFVKRQQSGI